METSTIEIIEQSASFRRMMNALRMVAVTDAPVLIHGEAGSGVSRVAGLLHQSSRLSALPLWRVAASGLDERELRERLDSSGSLCLEQVDELAPDLQGMLLRWLDGEARPGVRLLVTSHQDLGRCVEQGGFRQDLYYRLQVVPLEVPPLRERVEALAHLTRAFTLQAARYHGRRAPRFSVSAMNCLKRYGWPGNLRELRNLCERLVILHPGETLQPQQLPPEVRQVRDAQAVASGFRLPAQGLDLAGLEQDLIRQALDLSGGNRSQAARLLGLSRDTLLYRIQKYAIG